MPVSAAAPVTKIHERKVKPLAYLVNAIREEVSETKIPRHALLLGAGCSFNCGIPLGGGIVELCKLHAFIRDTQPDAETFLEASKAPYDAVNLRAYVKAQGALKAFEKYVSAREKASGQLTDVEKAAYLEQVTDMTGIPADTEGLWNRYGKAILQDRAYGIWIEALSEDPLRRQQFIEALMDGKEPDGAYILLAYLIAERKFTNILTTNFDDLINEALLYYTGTRCRFYADDELSQFISIYSSKPNIIKLHGDYRFANIANTNAETGSLPERLRSKLKQLFGELGLVVIGYNGADHSIMSVLYQLKKENASFPLIWCGQDPSAVHWRVAQLINTTPNSFFIQIESFEQVVGELVAKLRLSPEPTGLVQKAQEREAAVTMALRRFLDDFEQSKTSSSESKKQVRQTLTALDYAKQAYAAKTMEEQIRLYTEAIALDRNYALAYNNRGAAYNGLKQHERAIEDYDKVIALDENYAAAAYYNRSLAYRALGETEKADADAAKAKELEEAQKK